MAETRGADTSDSSGVNVEGVRQPFRERHLFVDTIHNTSETVPTCGTAITCLPRQGKSRRSLLQVKASLQGSFHGGNHLLHFFVGCCPFYVERVWQLYRE